MEDLENLKVTGDKQKEKSSLTKEQEEADYQRLKGSVEDFAYAFLPHFLTNKVPKFHTWIYQDLKTEKRLALAAPRGFAKSFLCSVIYPLHQALFEEKRDICIISASESLAIEWLRKIRFELEKNDHIIEYFGKQESRKWTETQIILRNGVTIRARGAGGQIRGFRPDLIILDDIETDESVASEDQRNKLRDWIFKACLNTLTPDGQFIIIGTLISPLALLAEILQSDTSWKKVKYRAYEHGKQEVGDELWPDLWPHSRLQERKKEIGSFAFSSEFLNDPLLNEEAPIKASQMRYWTELPKQYSCVIAVDPAYSEDIKSDYKVAVVVAIDQNSNRYLLTYIRTHQPTGEFIDGVLNLYQQYKPTLTGLGVPMGGTEKEFYRSLQNKAAERRLYPPFQELKNVFTTATGQTKRKKNSRIIAALQPLFESGKYYIRKEHEEARDELLMLGNAVHDDIPDALTYAETILQPIFYDMSNTERELDEEPIFKGDSGYGI